MVRIRLSLAVAAFVALSAFALWSWRARDAGAVINTVAANPNPVTNPANSSVTVVVQETDGGNGPVRLSVGAGALTFNNCQTAGPTGCASPIVSGSGTPTITLSAATDGDNTYGEPLAINLTFVPPTVSLPTSVSISGCQGVACSLGVLGNIVVNPTNLPAAGNSLAITTSALEVTCGSPVTVTAKVFFDADPVADGTFVVFGTSLGNAAYVATTMAGSASWTFTVPLGFAGTLQVTVATGNTNGQTPVEVICAASGTATQLAITVAPASITCGSTASILIFVRDQFGRPAGDGTTVTLSVDAGSIVPVVSISGGLATAVYTSIPNQPGLATITARTGSVTGQAPVTVNCAGPTSSPTVTIVPPTVVPSPLASPTAISPTAASGGAGITPPNTGDAGLAGPD